MARMLGISITCEPGSATDFELVTRLEKLILANQANIASSLPVDEAFSDLASASVSYTHLTLPTNREV